MAFDRERSDGARRTDGALLSLRELLGEARRRPTRLELICWQFNIDESRARPAWEMALRSKLLEPAGVDRLTGAELFALTDQGRNALRGLNGRRRA